VELDRRAVSLDTQNKSSIREAPPANGNALNEHLRSCGNQSRLFVQQDVIRVRWWAVTITRAIGAELPVPRPATNRVIGPAAWNAWEVPDVNDRSKRGILCHFVNTDIGSRPPLFVGNPSPRTAVPSPIVEHDCLRSLCPSVVLPTKSAQWSPIPCGCPVIKFSLAPECSHPLVLQRAWP
jgi:hypothetical protein